MDEETLDIAPCNGLRIPNQAPGNREPFRIERNHQRSEKKHGEDNSTQAEKYDGEPSTNICRRALGCYPAPANDHEGET